MQCLAPPLRIDPRSRAASIQCGLRADGRRADDGFGNMRDQQRGGEGNQQWESVFRVDKPYYDGPPIFDDEPFYDGPLVLDEEPPGPEDLIMESTPTKTAPNLFGESVHARGVGPVLIPVGDFSLHKVEDTIICMLHPKVKQSTIELAKSMEDDDDILSFISYTQFVILFEFGSVVLSFG
ncbi:UDP-Glycosyltransferase superfamily protein [Striga asiatica]|uniref:UDP-Glycosyltransferase superfamily protein n=1 Tax=Striga asiatica TaxID=4170 RepID=A0A5A7QLM9_STRAF|nr:UDP-Glycosyltransferase superfamily protein [Striga asiatica]